MASWAYIRHVERTLEAKGVFVEGTRRANEELAARLKALPDNVCIDCGSPTNGWRKLRCYRCWSDQVSEPPEEYFGWSDDGDEPENRDAD